MGAGTRRCKSSLLELISVYSFLRHIPLSISVHVQVTEKEQAEGVGSEEQAIVEVMVDLLLEMEVLTVSQGLIYVLDESESYSVSGMARQ